MLFGIDNLGRWSKRLIVLGAALPLLQFGGCSLESLYFSLARGFVQSAAVEIYAVAQDFFLAALGGQPGA